MRRTILIAAVLAMAATAPSYAQKIDAKGKCHGPDGKFAKMEVCKGGRAPDHTYKLDTNGKCRDEKGKFADRGLCDTKGGFVGNGKH